jgi:hypothetical protein
MSAPDYDPKQAVLAVLAKQYSNTLALAFETEEQRLIKHFQTEKIPALTALRKALTDAARE